MGLTIHLHQQDVQLTKLSQLQQQVQQLQQQPLAQENAQLLHTVTTLQISNAQLTQTILNLENIATQFEQTTNTTINNYIDISNYNATQHNTLLCQFHNLHRNFEDPM